MTTGINNLNRVIPGLIEGPNTGRSKGLTSPDTEKTSFTEIFSNMINSVNELQHESSDLQQSLLAGEPVELHQVMIKAEEAGISMDLLLEVRNKLITAYNELMRMPM